MDQIVTIFQYLIQFDEKMHAETKIFCVETIFLGYYSMENSC